MTLLLADKIKYVTENDLAVDLPAWAKFYLDLGKFAASPVAEPSERRILGVASPTRTLAAAFSAVGAVLRDFVGSHDPKTDDELFRYFCSLPTNSPIKYREQNKKQKEVLYDGVLLSTESVHGQTCLKIQLQKASMADPEAGGSTRYVSKANVRRLTVPTGDDTVNLDTLPTKMKGTKVSDQSRFALSILGQQAHEQFEAESKLAVLIVGSQAALDPEFREQTFRTPSGVNGTLSDLLRVKKFLPPGNIFRSNIFATGSRRPPKYDGDLCPGLVIFDGAAGFLKWRDLFPNSHWLVLLDATNPQFEAGRATLNERYLLRSGTDPTITEIPIVPYGVEMILFQEKMG